MAGNSSAVVISVVRDRLSSLDPDEELTRTAREGDKDAFMHLYERHVVKIERYVRHRVTDPADVEDVVSVIFLEALRHVRRYDPARAHFSTWLFGIATHTLHNYYRRSGRRVPAMSELSHAVDDPEATTIRNETVEHMQKTLTTLSQDQQDALALRFGAGLSFVEVGAALHRSESAAKMLVQRALAGLRREFRQENPQ
jgi:RNA polymerase sigma factor (sigma-70 family)